MRVACCAAGSSRADAAAGGGHAHEAAGAVSRWHAHVLRERDASQVRGLTLSKALRNQHPGRHHGCVISPPEVRALPENRQPHAGSEITCPPLARADAHRPPQQLQRAPGGSTACVPDDRGRLQIFDLATKEYREPDQSDTMIPPEPWQPPQPPPGAVLGSSMSLGGLGVGGEKRRSGSGRPKGSKDKTQRRPRSAAAQEFEKEVISQLTAFCGGLFAV